MRFQANMKTSALSSPFLSFFLGHAKKGNTPGLLWLLQGRRETGGLDTQWYLMAV